VNWWSWLRRETLFCGHCISRRHCEGGREACGGCGEGRGVGACDVERSVCMYCNPLPFIMSLLRDEQEDRQVELIATMQGYSVPKMKRRNTTGSFKS